VDALDLAVYRALSPGGEARFWAGRRVIDPLLPAREIAERVGISENGVRARLRGLENQGFLRGKAVTPNPSLFGVQVFVASLPVKEVGEVERIYRDLALVEGVIFARDTLDEGERQVRVYFVSENERTTVRRAALLRRLSPAGQVGVPQLYWIPPCERELTPLDWKVLQAVWRSPDASILETARAVHISAKTGARRYHQLIEARACWWTHSADSEEFPLALVRVEVQGPTHRDPVAGRILKEIPSWMPVASDGLGVEPGPEQPIAGLVLADAPTLLDRMIRRLAELPGVVRVQRTFALGSKTYPTWFADRISERVVPRLG